MKQFFKMTLATICGIVIFMVIMGFFMVISLLGMVASDSASTKVKENSVFVLKLDGVIDERAEAGFDSSRPPRTVAYQAPPSEGLSRQEYWSGEPLPYSTVYVSIPKSLV